jgi:hypothetical protein
MESALKSQAKCSEVLTVFGIRTRCVDLSWPLNEATIVSSNNCRPIVFRTQSQRFNLVLYFLPAFLISFGPGEISSSYVCFQQIKVVSIMLLAILAGK